MTPENQFFCENIKLYSLCQYFSTNVFVIEVLTLAEKNSSNYILLIENALLVLHRSNITNFCYLRKLTCL